MPINRTTILRGPAMVVFKTATFFSKDDISIPISLETFDVSADAFGKLTEHATQRKTEVSFTPSGQWDSVGAPPSVIWDFYRTMIAGTSIFSPPSAPVDAPIILTSLVDGTTVTGSAAAITKLPDIICSTTKTLLGSITFEILGANNVAWSVANSLITVGSVSTPVNTSAFVPANIFTNAYTAGIVGITGFTNFQTLDGIVVSFGLDVQPLTTDTDGNVDMYFKKLNVTATCTPLGMTEAQLIAALNIQGAGAGRGETLTGTNDLVITAVANKPVSITINKPGIKSASLTYSSTKPRMGQTVFTATKLNYNDSLCTIVP